MRNAGRAQITAQEHVIRGEPGREEQARLRHIEACPCSTHGRAESRDGASRHCLIMRRLFLRWPVVPLSQALLDQVLHLLQPAREGFDQSLLFVHHVAEVIDESLEVRVAGFEFRESLVVHDWQSSSRIRRCSRPPRTSRKDERCRARGALFQLRPRRLEPSLGGGTRGSRS